MSYKVDNAIIFAAGLSGRFVPISYEKHKGLIEVHGEILIERQIRQLKEVGIDEIVIIVGYKKEQFYYLTEKYGVILVENPQYAQRNTNGSVFAAREYFKNSYICLADNYFVENPFEKEVEDSYYATVYASGKTNEWCVKVNEDDVITEVTIGGEDAWYMLGHAFFTEKFSKKLLEILSAEYDRPETKDKYWENLYMEHVHELRLKIRRYDSNFLYEFDSLESLREFDSKYMDNSGSIIMQKIANMYNCKESNIKEISPIKDEDGIVKGMNFSVNAQKHVFYYDELNRD